MLNDADRMKGTEILSRYNHNKAAAEFQAEMSDELLRRQLAKLELSPYVGFAIDETVRTIVSIYRSITLVHSSCLALPPILCCFPCRRPFRIRCRPPFQFHCRRTFRQPCRFHCRRPCRFHCRRPCDLIFCSGADRCVSHKADDYLCFLCGC